MEAPAAADASRRPPACVEPDARGAPVAVAKAARSADAGILEAGWCLGGRASGPCLGWVVLSHWRMVCGVVCGGTEALYNVVVEGLPLALGHGAFGAVVVEVVRGAGVELAIDVEAEVPFPLARPACPSHPAMELAQGREWSPGEVGGRGGVRVGVLGFGGGFPVHGALVAGPLGVGCVVAWWEAGMAGGRCLS